ncbi:MAG: DNA recombination protein RmuC [Candidatus Magasanikbacteria bacterium]|jgi:DNA recombination protein RmuC|nr:DNA recombination protein RmuC [Candidatus Magasanikbacteria bacterium]MBT5262304.1 DNA recombination protein RmuC [Candidatus Magasanikbacteria bacterium]MBT5819851.1 DNA recombination protein RmuC [Candidatus Magasanikbacteria bacterium]MBT6294089.1 DNA recombination protein RmuC [Candidatus Magasanikbacteria bacterium]
METILFIVLIIIVLISVFFLYSMQQKLTDLQKPKEGDENLFIMIQNQIQEQARSVQDLTKTLDQKIAESTKSMNTSQQHLHTTLQEQFSQNTRLIQGISGQSTKMIGEITEKLTSLDKTNQQVIGFSAQLTNLEKVLTSQKQRGNLGEAGLQLVLENILPPGAFALQYEFEDGDTVDAAVFTKDGIIPVDAKFPLENYNKLVNEDNKERRAALEKAFKNDLKKRIDETAKYIKPQAGTMEFAFMFIPAEAIYYDLLVNEVGAVKVNTRNLIEYAFQERKVIIVSPTTFAAYLQTVLQGLRALKIEESAKSIRKNVEMLQKHIKAYEAYMQKLGNSMQTTTNHYNAAYKELGKIDKDVVRITQGERQIEVESIEGPMRTEE